MVESVHAKELHKKSPLGFNPVEEIGNRGEECSTPPKTESKAINLEGITARVDRVTVDGLSRTKDDIISGAVQGLFTANNFEEVIKEAHRGRQKLQSLGCFRNIAIHIDTSSGPGSSPNGYEVTYEVNELKRVSGGVTTSISDNAGIVTIGGFLPNLFGRGENLRGEVSYGSNKSNATNITFSKPYLSPYNPVLSFSMFGGETDYPPSGFSLAENGLLCNTTFSLFDRAKQKVEYECNWRRLGVGRQSSFFVRNKTGSTLKSAVRHFITIDKRDNPILPTCGNFAQLKTECAGLGGNVAFVKNELSLQANLPLSNTDFIVQGGLNIGMVKSLNDDELSVADNFFLGGPTTLRGFEPRAVGPKQDDNYVGASMYWAAAFHVFAPLPFRPASGGIGDLFRLHAFVNCGNIGPLDIGDIETWAKKQKEEMRVAAGLGIAVKLGNMARAELNFCVPVKFADSDSKIDGVQFGIGLDFI